MAQTLAAKSGQPAMLAQSISSKQRKGVSMMQQWEYEVVCLSEDQFDPNQQVFVMNKMASHGWRLVSVTCQSGPTPYMYLYFEKPKP